MNKVVTNRQTDGLQVTVAALKSVVSDYALRTRQAEELASLLMSEKLGPELLANAVFAKVIQHMGTRELERSTQYLGVLQTALLALNAVVQNTTDETLRHTLLEILKGLTIAANHGAPPAQTNSVPTS